ncbi:MAG TPA: AI-2E family transporter, partial [Steroidobacteraceae bacterium]
MGTLRDRATGIIAFATVLSLLYVGRNVLIPLTVAIMLSLLIAPLVRKLKRVGLGQTASVLLAVLTLALVVAGAAGVLGNQVLRMASSLPQYESTIQQKLRILDEMTVGRLNALSSEASRLTETHPANPESNLASGASDLASGMTPLPVEVRQPRASALQIVARVLASIWAPIESTGIVLVVLVFVLLEQEALRDRFIRVAGGS